MIQQPPSDIYEDVFVVPRHIIDDLSLCHGFTAAQDHSVITSLIANQHFLIRLDAEESDTWKQIIVYCVLQHNDSVFLFRRRGHGEAGPGLENRYSIGVGGHVSKHDVLSTQTRDEMIFIHSAMREIHEEVHGTTLPADDTRFMIVGFINDDSNYIGRRHLGIVITVQLQDVVQVKENGELQHDVGGLVSITEAANHRTEMENWSLMVLDGYLLGR